MLQTLTLEQWTHIQEEKRLKEQQEYAREGISTAIERDRIVTIGNADCDYLDFKHFIMAQIACIGFWKYANKYDWDIQELVYDIAEEDQDFDEWRQDTINYFGGMEADY